MKRLKKIFIRVVRDAALIFVLSIVLLKSIYWLDSIAFGVYTKEAKVFSVTETETEYSDGSGMLWCEYHDPKFEVGDRVTLVMNSHDTESFLDDSIVAVRRKR